VRAIVLRIEAQHRFRFFQVPAVHEDVCRAGPQILIRCPKFGRAIATGLQTEKVKFASLGGIQFSVVCSACGKIHRWRQRDAWIAGAENDELPGGFGG
jgi:hypothetical protein